MGGAAPFPAHARQKPPLVQSVNQISKRQSEAARKPKCKDKPQEMGELQGEIKTTQDAHSQVKADPKSHPSRTCVTHILQSLLTPLSQRADRTVPPYKPPPCHEDCLFRISQSASGPRQAGHQNLYPAAKSSKTYGVTGAERDALRTADRADRAGGSRSGGTGDQWRDAGTTGGAVSCGNPNRDNRGRFAAGDHVGRETYHTERYHATTGLAQTLHGQLATLHRQAKEDSSSLWHQQ